MKVHVTLSSSSGFVSDAVARLFCEIARTHALAGIALFRPMEMRPFRSAQNTFADYISNLNSGQYLRQRWTDSLLDGRMGSHVSFTGPKTGQIMTTWKWLSVLSKVVLLAGSPIFAVNFDRVVRKIAAMICSAVSSLLYVDAKIDNIFS